VFLPAFSYAQTCNGPAANPAPGKIWPTSGQVTGVIGDGRPGHTHAGVDIANNTGTPILAAADGVVSSTPTGGPGGIEIVIEHPDGTATSYSHLSKRNVSVGTPVKQGQQIGEMGSTGESSGPHLHFQIYPPGSSGVLQVNGKNWDVAACVNHGQNIKAGTNTGTASGGQLDEEALRAEAFRRCQAKEWMVYTWTDPDEVKKQKMEKCIQEEIKKLKSEAAVMQDITGVPEPLVLENILPTPEVWMAETNKLLDQHNIPGYARDLGIALLFAGFVYSLVSLMRAHASDQLFLLFGRLIIAAGLIFAAPNIRSGSDWIWKGTYDVMKANVVKPAVDDLQKGLNDLYPLLASLASISVASKFIAAMMPDVPVLDAGEEGFTAVGDLAEQSARGLFIAMLMLAGLYGVYFLSIYGSGMIMILAATLVPVLMAFLVIPGMASWFNRWFAMAFTSLLMVVVFPLLFSVIVTLGVNKPMEKVNKELAGVQQTAQDFVKTLNTMPEVSIQKAPDLIGWSYTAIVQMATIGWKLIFVAVPLTLSIVLLVLSVGASMYLMQQLPSLLSSFIGGNAGSAAHMPSGAAFAAGISAATNTATSGAIGAGGKAISGAGKVGAAAVGGAKKASQKLDNWVKSKEKPADSKSDSKSLANSSDKSSQKQSSSKQKEAA
jgi:hypothetical protein